MLNPSSLAVVGATESSAWSAALIGKLRLHGYAGRLHLVNPRHQTQFGLPCHPTVSAIGEPVDYAYVMTPTDAVPGVIEDLAAAGAHSAGLRAAGYRETGAEGAARERALVERCREAGIVLLGPNCLGFINYRQGIAAHA